jgi:hypothetical protein
MKYLFLWERLSSRDLVISMNELLTAHRLPFTKRKSGAEAPQ